MNWTSLLFSFNGRINRGKYWLVGLVFIVVWMVFGAAMLSWLGGINPDNLFSLAGGALGFWAGAFVLVVAGSWAALATGVKRLHDRDRSGWWMLLIWFGPSVLGSATSTMPDGSAAAGFVLSIAGFAIAVWGFVELGCLRGTAGPNQYGPDPLQDNVSVAPGR
jgi:uncharacterized membrane protein YhaH (DUF805 family)